MSQRVDTYTIKCSYRYNLLSDGCVTFFTHVGLSDPYVEIVMMPERRFKIKALKTDFKSKDVCPTYYKDFKMYVHIVTISMRASASL